jgi:hypothetical protein
MANKWLAHVKKTMKSHKDLKFGQVLKLAKKTYSKKGGADDEVEAAEPVMEMPTETPAPAAGRRRRSRKTARKTRRSRK